ncbi:COMPASS (complex proteins associated with Set1p) component [Pleurotus ostreatus]|nr:COMPASS (complex proteins associated with Set1p) component [Pleurotus ostreatus]
MASRRLDISSLLNDGDDAKHHQPSAPSPAPASFSAPSFQQQHIVAEPVVLAPHLRSNSSQRALPPQTEYNAHNSLRDPHIKESDIRPHSSSTRGRFPTPTSTGSSDFSSRQKPYSEYVEQDADRTRAAHPVYRSEQPSQPRPSSSRSSNSPHVAYRYPQASTAVSPTVSPSSNAVIERFPPVHHPSAYTKHPHSISQSQSRAVEHPQANPYPQAQTSSSPSNPFNLLVHIANEERRKLSGSEVSDSMPRPGSPSRQHSRRSQYGGTSDLVAPESIKKPSDWYPGRGDRADEAHRETQAPYPHRTQRMPIHDQPSQQPQPSMPHPSNHHIPSVPEPHVSPSEPSARLLDSRLRMQKQEEQRQKTEEQRRRHQLRLEEQKILNDQREQQRQLQRLQMQREQQQREHERMKAEVAARDRARLMDEKEREHEEKKFIERPRATPHVEGSPHDRHPTSAPPVGAFPSASASPAPPRRPLSMESLLHPQSHPSPSQHQHRPFGSPAEASTSGQSHPSNTRSYQSQYGPLPPLEAPHPPRLPHPSRKSDPGVPSLAQAQSPPQPLKRLTSPATSHPPTLSHLVASPSHQPHQTVSPSLHVLLSPSQASIRLPPPLSDPRPPKKPRVSPEDSYHHPSPSSTRLTPREEQTILAIRDEKQRKEEEARRRVEERRQHDEREELRRKRTREMQLERERQTELEGQRMRQESGSTSGKSHHVEERKPDFPYPISAEPTSIFAPPHRPQIIELLPRDDPSPPPRPPPRQLTRTPIQASPPARTRVSPPRVVKLETVEGPPEVRQPKRLPPGSQEGRAKAARRVDSTSSHLTPHEAVNPPPETWSNSDTKPVGEGPAKTLMADVGEERMDDERGPGRAKQVAKDKKGSRTHSLLRFPGSDAKPVSPPPQRSEPEKASPPSQPSQKQPISPKNHPSQDDVHKWLLEQSTDAPSPSRSDPKPEAKASPVTPAVGPKAAATDATTNSSPAMTISDDAVTALEQELEDILMEEPEREADTIGGDIDKEVTSLVAETLDTDTEPPQHKSQPRELDRAPQPTSSMEVDVEDELLSLVDDKPQHAAHRGRSSPHMATLDAKPSSRKASESGSRPASPPTRPPSALQTSGVEPTPERGSMPPPAPKLATSKSKEKDSEKESSSAPSKKKSGPKPKATTVTASSKARAKPAPKPKPKNADSSTVAGSKTSKSASKKVPPAVNANANARSRSTSAMPSGSVGPEGETAVDKDKEKENEPEDETPADDDKLYCVCKTKYDEDRVMIACDRCDEWYHTQCVSMPDLEVDLVDQFICPLCIQRHPHLSLCTTYKKRCLFGLSHPTPSSPDACHKPARGALSKYCSDECGFKCVQARIDDWAKQGGKRETLWENVKNAEKREGVVILHGGDGQEAENATVRVMPEKSKSEKEVERLNGLLDLVVNQREEVKMGMEVVGWRERLLELASDRAQQLGECGWDQRLCFGDEEYVEYGEGVLESYEMLTSGDVQSDVESEGEWWCRGPTKCERHLGWQGVRHKDVQKEKQNKEEALLKLTTREREIRKLMEDLAGQQVSNPDTLSKSPWPSPIISYRTDTLITVISRR